MGGGFQFSCILGYKHVDFPEDVAANKTELWPSAPVQEGALVVRVISGLQDDVVDRSRLDGATRGADGSPNAAAGPGRVPRSLAIKPAAQTLRITTQSKVPV